MVKEVQEGVLKFLNALLSKEGLVGILLLLMVASNLYDENRETDSDIQFQRALNSYMEHSQGLDDKRVELLRRLVESTERLSEK